MNNKKIELPVTLYAGCAEGASEQAQAIRKIEKAALYLQSIFNLIKIASETLENSDDYQIQHLGGDFRHLSEIGYGVADALLPVVMTFAPGEPQQTAQTTETTENLDSLARDISALLNREDLPPTIYSGLREGIVQTFNEQTDQTEILEYQNSPEYIAQILRGLEVRDE